MHLKKTALNALVLTLYTNEDKRNLLRVPVVDHFGVVAIDGVERRLVLQAEHEYHCVHPACELNNQRLGFSN